MKTAKDCFKHAIKRARERYDEWFTIKDMERMSLLIRQGKAKHLLNESHSRTHWLIEDKYIVVYNKNLSAITTFLPPEKIFLYLPLKSGS
jgi:hypothetical protein